MKSIVLAFAMFSRLPMPRVAWSEKNMRYLLAAFPLVGAAVGGAVALWDLACVHFQLGPLLRGAGFAVIPLVCTGGIHMDGYCDVMDALASQGDAATKERIRKDPHIGSFAAMAAFLYILLFAALGSETAFSISSLPGLAALFVLSRSLGGLAVLLFPASEAGGLGKTFRDATPRPAGTAILAGFAIGSGVVMIVHGGVSGIVALCASIATLLWCRRIAACHLGGMNGDLSGWLVQVSELSSLACLAVVPLVTGAA